MQRPLAGGVGRIVIIADENDKHARSQPALWAISELQRVLEEKCTAALVIDSPRQLTDTSIYVVVTSSQSQLRTGFPTAESAPRTAESFSLRPGSIFGNPALLVEGSDERGLTYGLLELADRVRFGGEPMQALMLARAVDGKPANAVRSIARAFVSDVEDKEWYYDKTFWREYLTDLATNRFNRFSLSFGLGYDFPKGVTGDYFHFPYPYLFDVPGYQVKVVPLTNAERERNLEMLKFITDETKARGLECQIGLWTHAYQWVDSPNSNHHIEGLNDRNHAEYSRDALALLLKSCPAIQGVTLRVHGESGIPEGSYSFWQTVFEAFRKSGRRVEVDMHAKGLESKMIGIAVDTGMPVKISPKYWAEHLGLGYHQADIRDLEVPHGEAKEAVFKLSNGARKFLRYGYGDLFQQGRKYDVLFRIWPGTQRVLLWGDPALAAGYGHTSHFCGASGVEIFEPLFFKGRQGSGLAGGRCAYLDKTLIPKGGDWAKFKYTYRVWGRLLFDPKADPSEWRRYLTDEFGGAAPHMETAVAHASRVLPLVTTAHLPSASNNSFWPEIYTNMPIVEGSAPEPYGDTPSPKRFGTVSPLDPALFSTIEQHTQNLLDNKSDARYSPMEVAQWLEDLSTSAERALNSTGPSAKSSKSPEFRRMEEDVRIQIGLGLFFAHKLRSGVFYELYLKSNEPGSLDDAIREYQTARNAWASMAKRAATVYRSDITFGPQPIKRGHWTDRLPAIDKDLSALQALKTQASGQQSHHKEAGKVLATLKMKPGRPAIKCTHTPPNWFRPGEALQVDLHIDGSGSAKTATLYYRHVNQGERWKSMPVERYQTGYKAAIPGAYTKSPYPMQYYFEFTLAGGEAVLYPGLNSELNNQPYFAIQPA
jgi:hypothetical protein